MLFKKKPADEFIELLVDVLAVSDKQSNLMLKAEFCLNWLKTNHSIKFADEMITMAAIRKVEIEKHPEYIYNQCPKQKVPVFVPRRVCVPSGRAIEVIQLWDAFLLKKKSKEPWMIELYKAESLLYELCPVMLQWGQDVDYQLDVQDGALWVIEYKEDEK